MNNSNMEKERRTCCLWCIRKKWSKNGVVTLYFQAFFRHLLRQSSIRTSF